MNLDDYQQLVEELNLTRGDIDEYPHLINGLVAEVGEVAGAYQKLFRGDFGEEELLRRLEGELGGLLWYFTALCTYEGFTVQGIMDDNAKKLKSRRKRGVLQGDGDDR